MIPFTLCGLLSYGLPYKAVYRIEGDKLLVLAIIHTSLQFPT